MERNFIRRLERVMERSCHDMLSDFECFSEDPSTKVACVLFDDKFRFVSTGFNRAVNRFPKEIFPWDNKSMKYSFVVHAEVDAVQKIKYIENCAKPIIALVSLFPCSTCAKALIDAGVKYVIYKDIRFNEDARDVMAMFQICGVQSIQL